MDFDLMHERVHLSRMALPCGSDSASQSLLQPLLPSLPTISLNPLASVVTPKVDIHVPLPTRTNGKTLVPSALTPIPIHADNTDSLSTSFQMSAVQSSREKPTPLQ
jgi:hypothetical protein